MKKAARLALALSAWTASAFADSPPARSFEFTYDVEVESIPADAASIRVWVPVPQTTDRQSVENVRVIGAPNHRFAAEEKFGNKYLVVDVKPGTERAHFEMVFDATRAQARTLDAENGTTLEDRDLYLTPTRMMKSDGPIAEEARQAAGSISEPLSAARALYDHIVDTMVYDKTGEGWGRGDTAYACDARKGNCTDFHSLFIGEAMSLGVPSRFLMGFSIPADAAEGEIAGYHCWAEFFVEGRGWIPVDASEAFKDQSRRDELFGGLDENRIQFTIGRDIALPEAQGEPANFSIYPYAEIDGKSHEAVQKKFRYRDLR